MSFRAAPGNPSLPERLVLREDALTAPRMKREEFTELQRLLPPVLPDFLAAHRWFGGKAHRIRATEVADIIPFGASQLEAFMVLARVEYETGLRESYLLPLLVWAAEEAPIEEGLRTLKVQLRGEELLLTDALRNENFLLALHAVIEAQAMFRGLNGALRARQSSTYRDLCPASAGVLKPKPMGVEQSNSSIIYGNRLVLKVFRHVEPGMNPDLEIGRFLSERVHFAHVPAVAGWLEYAANDGQEATLGILQEFVPNQGDAWRFTLNSLSEFWQQANGRLAELSTLIPRSLFPLSMSADRLPGIARELNGPYLDAAALLAQRTAQLHLALASEPTVAAFAPEPYTPQFQDSLRQSLHKKMQNSFALLRTQFTGMPRDTRADAERVLAAENEVLRSFEVALSQPIAAMRTRIHGDYHLGQVLYTGSDFVMIDFEGEPARPISERSVKLSPLQDVAGMLRSFHYAAFASVFTTMGNAEAHDETTRQRLSVAQTWFSWVAAHFTHAYLSEVGSASFIPENEEQLVNLLRLHLLEKAVYELSYELNNRPDWVRIPLAGILSLLSS
ncbi:MAG: putative maltokinase [Candidatus Acidiferrales bacterium]